MQKTYRIAKLAADLKDNYIQLLEEGYKPDDIEKFVKDVKVDPEKAKSPTPTGGGSGMTKIPSSFGSLAEDEKYLATTFDPNMGSEKKNPEMSKDVEDLKKNDHQPSGKASKKAFITGDEELREIPQGLSVGEAREWLLKNNPDWYKPIEKASLKEYPGSSRTDYLKGMLDEIGYSFKASKKASKKAFITGDEELREIPQGLSVGEAREWLLKNNPDWYKPIEKASLKEYPGSSRTDYLKGMLDEIGYSFKASKKASENKVPTKNPEPETDLEYLKGNDFDRKKCGKKAAAANPYMDEDGNLSETPMFLVDQTSEVWDQGASESGQTDEQGFEFEDRKMSPAEMEREFGREGYSFVQSDYSGDVWKTQMPEETRDYWEKGEDKYFTIFINRLDGSKLTEEDRNFLKSIL